MTDTVRWMIFAADGGEEPRGLMRPKSAEDMATEKDGKTGDVVIADAESTETAENVDRVETAEMAENMGSIEDTDVIFMSLIQMQKEQRDSMPD